MRAGTSKPSSKQLTRLVSLLLLAAVGVAVAFSTFESTLVYSPSALLLFLALGVLIVAAIQDIPEARSQPLSAFSHACLLWLVGFVYRGVSLSISGATYHHLWGDPASRLPAAALLCIAGFGLLWFGYRSDLPGRVARAVPFVVFPRASRMTMPELMRMMYILYAVGWLGRLMLFKLGAFHGRYSVADSAVQYLSWIRMVANFSELSLWGLMALKHSRRDALTTFVPWFIIEFLYGLVDGGRTKMVMGIYIYFFTKSLYSARPISWRNLVGVAALGMLLVFPILTIFRFSYHQVTREEDPGLASAFQATDRWAENYEIASFGNLQSGIAIRFGHLDPMLTVLDRVPSSYSFQRGETFVPYTLTALIPRVIWKDKPLFDMGRTTSQLFFDIDDGATSTSLGTLADTYYNFGIFGLPLMVLIGAWLRFHWERYCVYRTLEPISSLRIPILLQLASPMLPLVAITAGFQRTFFDLYVYYIIVFGLPRLARWSTVPVPGREELDLPMEGVAR